MHAAADTTEDFSRAAQLDLPGHGGASLCDYLFGVCDICGICNFESGVGRFFERYEPQPQPSQPPHDPAFTPMNGSQTFDCELADVDQMLPCTSSCTLLHPLASSY